MSRLIESLIGHQSTDVGGSTYVFTKDDHGRFVALVHNLVHVQCLLSSACYREAPLVMPVEGQTEPPVATGNADETNAGKDDETGTAQVSPAAPITGTVDGTQTQSDGSAAASAGAGASVVTGIIPPAEPVGDQNNAAAATVKEPVVTDTPEPRQKRQYKPRAKKADTAEQQGE